jgi:hypothetical protein
VNGLADLGRVVIEGRNDVQVASLQPAVSEQGGPEAACTNQEGLGQAIPAQRGLYRPDQGRYRKPDPGRTHDARVLEILSDLHRIELELAGDQGTRHQGLSLRR